MTESTNLLYLGLVMFVASALASAMVVGLREAYLKKHKAESEMQQLCTEEQARNHGTRRVEKSGEGRYSVIGSFGGLNNMFINRHMWDPRNPYRLMMIPCWLTETGVVYYELLSGGIGRPDQVFRAWPWSREIALDFESQVNFPTDWNGWWWLGVVEKRSGRRVAGMFIHAPLPVSDLPKTAAQ